MKSGPGEEMAVETGPRHGWGPPGDDQGTLSWGDLAVTQESARLVVWTSAAREGTAVWVTLSDASGCMVYVVWTAVFSVSLTCSHRVRRSLLPEPGGEGVARVQSHQRADQRY